MDQVSTKDSPTTSSSSSGSGNTSFVTLPRFSTESKPASSNAGAGPASYPQSQIDGQNIVALPAFTAGKFSIDPTNYYDGWGSNLAYHDPGAIMPHEYMAGMVQHNASPQVDVNNIIKNLVAKHGHDVDIHEILPPGMSPAQQQQVIDAWNHALAVKPPDDDEEENPESSGPKIFGLAAGTAAAGANVFRRWRTYSLRAIRKGMDKWRKRVEEAKAEAKEAKIKSLEANKELEKIEHAVQVERAGEKGLAKAGAVAEDMKKGGTIAADLGKAAEAAQAGRAVKKGIDKAEQELADQRTALEKREKELKELREDAARKAKLARELEQKQQKAEKALKTWEQKHRVAEQMRKDFGGLRRALSIGMEAAKATGESFIMGALVMRAVKALAIYALAPPGMSAEEAKQLAWDVATESPFSKAATKKFHEGDYLEGAKIVGSDIAHEAKHDVEAVINWGKKHPPEVLAADAKAIYEGMERYHTLYKENPELAKAVAGEFLHKLGIAMPQSFEEARNMTFNTAAGKGSGLGSRLAGAVFDDDKFINDAFALYEQKEGINARDKDKNDKTPNRPAAPTVIAHADEPSTRPNS